jgi:hypothetical protein
MEVSIGGDCFVQDIITIANSDKYGDKEIFFIMGEVQEVVGYSNQINILEDLKGNYKDKFSVTVWGEDLDNILESNLLDNLSCYNAGDTLVMLMTPRTPIWNGIKQTGDFETITCCYSVLKYSNGYVTGYIRELQGCETMLWSDLQKLIKEKSE